MNIKVGDKVKMNGKYFDMPDDGKIYSVLKIGEIGIIPSIWIKGEGAFAKDGFKLVESADV